jgi:hypothetical protein
MGAWSLRHICSTGKVDNVTINTRVAINLNMFRCLIINPPLANRSHGTGKQLQYFVQSSKMECHHLCWDEKKPLGDEPCSYTNLYYDTVKRWPIYRGRCFFDRLQRRCGLRWSDAGKLSALSAWKVRQLRKHKFDAAYVIVASEMEAKLAHECLRLLGLPYILNWMDLAEHAELSPQTHPGIATLCKGATTVFALTHELARCIGRCASREIQIIRVGRPASTAVATPPAVAGPLRCVMIGNLHHPSVSRIWPEVFDMVKRSGVDARLFYMGSMEMFNLLPQGFPVTHLGSLGETDRDAKLAEMHLGLLPGPDGLPATHPLARYSFPSRIADYFFLGLPVLGSIHPRSATAEELRPVLNSAVWLSTTAPGLAESMMRLSGDPEVWSQASAKGLAFARDNFDYRRIVKTLTESLRSATVKEAQQCPLKSNR